MSTDSAWTDEAVGPASTPPRHEVDETLLEPFKYINQVPGKDVRGKMIDAFQVWLKIPAEKIDAIKEIVGMLHNASLLPRWNLRDHGLLSYENLFVKAHSTHQGIIDVDYYVHVRVYRFA